MMRGNRIYGTYPLLFCDGLWDLSPFFMGLIPFFLSASLGQAGASNVDFTQQARGGLVELVRAAQFLEFLEQVVRTQTMFSGA
jgi:hypothetical protein